MTRGRPGRRPAPPTRRAGRSVVPLVVPVVVPLALLLAVALTAACGPVARSASAPPPDPASTRAVVSPDSADDLGELVVTEVPSGRPRVPDAQLRPPAGEKSLDDVASYAGDPAQERTVLRDYGFRFGWERFWGTVRGQQTSVFLDQFTEPSGAGAFTADLAHNDAEHYRAVVHEDPPALPPGCRLLTVDRAEPEVGLSGPAAIAWCTHGVFSVAVTSVAGSDDAAEDEVATLVRRQLTRLPG